MTGGVATGHGELEEALYPREAGDDLVLVEGSDLGDAGLYLGGLIGSVGVRLASGRRAVGDDC